MKNISKYNKFWVALGAAFAALGAASTDGVITGGEASTVLLAFIGAAGVFFARNEQ
jgi:hypothetical protein